MVAVLSALVVVPYWGVRDSGTHGDSGTWAAIPDLTWLEGCGSHIVKGTQTCDPFLRSLKRSGLNRVHEYPQLAHKGLSFSWEKDHFWTQIPKSSSHLPPTNGMKMQETETLTKRLLEGGRTQWGKARFLAILESVRSLRQFSTPTSFS